MENTKYNKIFNINNMDFYSHRKSNLTINNYKFILFNLIKKIKNFKMSKKI